MNAILTQNLTRKFGDKTAVDRLELSIAEGELFALLGVNGAGKTTAIRMICGLLRPTESDAFLLGKSITSQPDEAKTSLTSRRRKLPSLATLPRAKI